MCWYEHCNHSHICLADHLLYFQHILHLSLCISMASGHWGKEVLILSNGSPQSRKFSKQVMKLEILYYIDFSNIKTHPLLKPLPCNLVQSWYLIEFTRVFEKSTFNQILPNKQLPFNWSVGYFLHITFLCHIHSWSILFANIRYYLSMVFQC